MSQKLDDIDRKIIEFLRKDARTPFTEIGKKLGMSDATVHFRVKKMFKAGIIRRYTIEADEGAYESQVSCYMLIKAKHGKVQEISKQLIAIEKVDVVQEVHGSNDVIVKIEASDLEKLRNVITKIQRNPNIVTSEYLTVLKTWKK